MVSPILVVIGLLIIAAFSVLAGRAEEAFWSKYNRQFRSLCENLDIRMNWLMGIS